MRSISDITAHWKFDTRDLQQKDIFSGCSGNVANLNNQSPACFRVQWKNAKTSFSAFSGHTSLQHNCTFLLACWRPPFQLATQNINQEKISLSHVWPLSDMPLLIFQCSMSMTQNKFAFASSRKVLAQANGPHCRLAALLAAPSFPPLLLQARTYCRHPTPDPSWWIGHNRPRVRWGWKSRQWALGRFYASLQAKNMQRPLVLGCSCAAARPFWCSSCNTACNQNSRGATCHPFNFPHCVISNHYWLSLNSRGMAGTEGL